MELEPKLYFFHGDHGSAFYGPGMNFIPDVPEI